MSFIVGALWLFGFVLTFGLYRAGAGLFTAALLGHKDPELRPYLKIIVSMPYRPNALYFLAAISIVPIVNIIVPLSIIVWTVYKLLDTKGSFTDMVNISNRIVKEYFATIK